MGLPYPIVECEKCGTEAANAGDRSVRDCVDPECDGAMSPNGDVYEPE